MFQCFVQIRPNPICLLLIVIDRKVMAVPIKKISYTAILTFLKEGLMTERLGARIIDAVKADEFYIFSHPENRAQVEARHDRIIDGFENLDRWLSSHPD